MYIYKFILYTSNSYAVTSQFRITAMFLSYV